MTDYIWLIGGSLMSVPMAKEIKRRGYGLLLTDINEQCACREYANKFYPISVFDEDYHRALAKVWRWGNVVEPEQYGKIAAVLCIGCDAGPTASLVSEYLDLPGEWYEVARRVKNKWEVRRALKLDHPHYSLVSDDTLISNKPLNRWNYPVSVEYPSIVKPLVESGSRGFRVVSNKTELFEAIKIIKGFALVEELLIGQDVIPEWRDKYGFDTSEIALDFFVQDGKVYYANGALRMFWADLPGIEAGHINPIPFDIYGSGIIEKAQYAAEKLGVTWGPFKCDFKQDQRYGWVVMECATRLSGGFDHPYTCIEATGKNITKIMLDIALGHDLVLNDLKPSKNKLVCAYAPRFQPGEIWGWNMSEKEVETTDHFKVKHCFKVTRKEIKPLLSNQDRPLFIITKGHNNQEAALQSALNVESAIAPIYKA